MIPGMPGMSSKQMKVMMKKMGIRLDAIEDVTRVIIETPDKNLIFTEPEVVLMETKGVSTYQVSGTPEEVAVETPIPDEDIVLVMEQTEVGKEEAHAALIEANGDLAEAIIRLKGGP